MAYLADFLPFVLPWVSGCSTPLAELHIRQTCIDFCNHAPVVQERLDPMDAIKGQTEYEIDSANGTETTHIRQAFFMGQFLPITNGIDLINFPKDEPPGIPTALQQKAGNAFELNRAPDRDMAKAIVLEIATRPTRNAHWLADILLNDYAHGIGQGVVARLAMMPGHAFSNPGLAAQANEQYLQCRTDARIRAFKGFGATPSRVKPRRFQ